MHCLTGKTRQMRMEIDMEDKMLTLEKFEEASEIVRKVTQETKLVYSDFYSAQTGGKVYLKPENMQFTGAYKLRGAYYKISTLSEEERAKGLITASAGNHAQGVAYAAKCYGAKAVIVMPVGTPLIKVNRTKNYGAEVILYGDVYDEACARAYELAEEKGKEKVWERVKRGGWITGYSTKHAIRLNNVFIVEGLDRDLRIEKHFVFEYLFLYQRKKDGGVSCKVRVGPRRFWELSDVV